MTTQPSPTPQDAPLGRPWPDPEWRPASEPPTPSGVPSPQSSQPAEPASPPAEAPGQPSRQPEPFPASAGAPHSTPTAGIPAAPAPTRRVLPAQTGPNWALMVVGVLLMVSAGGGIAYLFGYRAGTIQVGPQLLIGVGALLVLVGVVGSLVRRRSGRTLS